MPAPVDNHPQTIKPVIELSIPHVEGQLGPPRVEFDDTSSRVFFKSIAPEPIGWWRRNECEVSAVVALLGAALIVYRLFRCMSRHQLPGHSYCTRCNYDLTSAKDKANVAPAFAVCPECGDQTAGRSVRGQNTFTRMRWSLVLLVPLFVLGVWRCTAWLSFRQPGLSAWPFKQCTAIWAGWPLARVETAAQIVWFLQSSRLSSTGRELTQPFSFTTATEGLPTPDGGKWAWIEYGEKMESQVKLCWVDLATSTRKTLSLGTQSDYPGVFQGFIPDGQSAVFARSDFPTSESRPDDQFDIEIYSIDLLTGSRKTIARTKTAPRNFDWSQMRAAVRGSGDPLWALLVPSESGGDTLITGNASGERRTQSQTKSANRASHMTFGPSGALELHNNTSAAEPQVLDLDGTLRPRRKTGMVYSGNRVSLEIGREEVAVLDRAFLSRAVSWSLSPDTKWLVTSSESATPGLPKSTTVQIWDVSRKP